MEWISVKNGLPALEEEVIWFDGEKSLWIASLISHVGYTCPNSNQHLYWMPFPKVPEKVIEIKKRKLLKSLANHDLET